jgi:hypothetical protein
VKALAVLAAACAALICSASAIAADRVVERGIVQSVDATALHLRALDGTEVRIPLGPTTRLRLNGRLTTIDAIRSGFVAEAVTTGTGPAVVVRAFGRASASSQTGRLVRVRPRAIVLRRGPGDLVRIPLSQSTRVWRGAARLRLGALREGMRVQVVLAANGSARVILVHGGG